MRNQVWNPTCHRDGGVECQPFNRLRGISAYDLKLYRLHFPLHDGKHLARKIRDRVNVREVPHVSSENKRILLPSYLRFFKARQVNTVWIDVKVVECAYRRTVRHGYNCSPIVFFANLSLTSPQAFALPPCDQPKEATISLSAPFHVDRESIDQVDDSRNISEIL